MQKLAIIFLFAVLFSSYAAANPVLNDLTNTTVAEGATLNISVSSSAPDSGDTLFAIDASPERGFSSIAKLSNTEALITLQPGFTHSGNYTITITASDGNSEDEAIFSLIVTNTNRAPTIDLPASRTLVTESENDLLLTQFSSDPDNDALNFSVLSHNPSQVNCSVQGNRLFMTAAPGFFGTGSCMIQVNDGLAAANDTIQFPITQPNFLFGSIGDITFPEVFPGDSASRQITIRNAGTGTLTNVMVVLNVDPRFMMNVSLQSLGTLGPGASQAVTLRLTIPNSTTSGSSSIGSLNVVSAETNRTATVFVDVGSRLAINDVDVTIDTTSDDNLLDGDTIDERAQPLDKIEFDIDVENNFATSTEIEIEDIEVKVTIKDLDNGRDLDDKAREFDLDAGDDETVTLTFETPRDIEEKSFDVLVEAKGKDKNGNRYHTQWTLILRTDKETHDIKIFSHSVAPSKVSCGHSFMLRAELVNLGGKNEKDVRLTAQNGELGIDAVVEGIEIDEDPDDNNVVKSFSFPVPATVESGSYAIEMKAYYDTNILDDLVRASFDVVCSKAEPIPEGLPGTAEIEEVDEVDNEDAMTGEVIAPITPISNGTSRSQVVYGTTKAPEASAGLDAKPADKPNLFAVVQTPGYLVVIIVLLALSLIGLIAAFVHFQKNKESLK